jgi:alkaline phosphatase D
MATLMSYAPPSLAAALGYPRSLQGPMVGAPGPNHFTVWVRASGSLEVVLEFADNRDFANPRRAAPVRATAATDFCVTLRAEGLQPATDYWYRLRFEGEVDRYQQLPHRTRTAPAGPADFRVAFGSCCRIQFDDEQRIFNVVQMLEPDLFCWLGDNIYADSDSPDALADLYRRQRTVDRCLPVLRRIPSVAIWDDHDFGYNDSDGTNPIKDESARLFRSYWANPPRPDNGDPAIYFSLSYGGVDFFFTDGRYHRSPSTAPDGPDKTMLGARQLAWLKSELKKSRAPFKVIASGGGFSSAEADGGDSWAVYRRERDELFDYIRDQKIEGVVCISGDSHMGELNCIPRSAEGGYDIYDMVSSPLAQMPAAKYDQVPEVRVRELWTRSVNVGVLTFTMTPEPKLTYTLHDVMGAPVWDPLVLTPADLRNGVKTWDRLADPKELARLQRWKEGRGYYGRPPGDA